MILKLVFKLFQSWMTYRSTDGSILEYAKMMSQSNYQLIDSIVDWNFAVHFVAGWHENSSVVRRSHRSIHELSRKSKNYRF